MNMGIFSKIKNALKKTRDGLAGALSNLFSKNKLGSEFYDELEEILIGADISVTTAEEVVEELRLASVAGFAFNDFSGNFRGTLFDYVFAETVVGKFRRINALYQFARGAHDNKSEVRHISYIMNRAFYRNFLSDMVFKFGVRSSGRSYNACNLLHIMSLVNCFL